MTTPSPGNTPNLASVRDLFEQACQTLEQARIAFLSAGNVYDAARRSDQQSHLSRATAHQAWALAGMEWMRLLIAKEHARDQLSTTTRHNYRDAKHTQRVADVFGSPDQQLDARLDLNDVRAAYEETKQR